MIIVTNTWANILLILSILSFILATQLIYLNNIILLEWDFTTIMTTPLYLYILLDPLGLILSAVVLFISSNIIKFSTFYIEDEVFLNRFIHLVIIFVLSINILILIPHFIFLLLGWDGLGLTSFLLVIYYYSPNALGAGIITALTNRIGDVLILVSIGGFLILGQWNIISSWEIINNNIFIILILVASITKSAQIPFSSWLPAAIAAPTPVSALVHSSTLVTAGIFLLVRFYPFLSSSPIFFKLLIITSCSTIIMAGLIAIIETDLNNIIALSTLSQLGVIMSSIALGIPVLALFHLMTHALFNALLFMCAGSLIHLNNHNQDLRLVGNIISQIPLTSAAFLISNIALCGLPFLAGFYSNDLILEHSIFNSMSAPIIIIIALGTGLTAGYSIRFLLIGWTCPTYAFNLHNINDNNLNNALPEQYLSIGAIVGGSAINWIIITPNISPIITNTYNIVPVTTIVAALILTSIYITTINNINLNNNTVVSSTILMWFLSPLSTQSTINYSILASIVLLNTADQGWNEYLGGEGLNSITNTTTNELGLSQNNMPTIHLTLVILSLIPTLIMA